MIAIVKGNICDVYKRNLFSCTSIVLAFDLILLFDSISQNLYQRFTKNVLSFFVSSTCYVYMRHMVVKKKGKFLRVILRLNGQGLQVKSFRKNFLKNRHIKGISSRGFKRHIRKCIRIPGDLRILLGFLGTLSRIARTTLCTFHRNALEYRGLSRFLISYAKLCLLGSALSASIRRCPHVELCTTIFSSPTFAIVTIG